MAYYLGDISYSQLVKQNLVGKHWTSSSGVVLDSFSGGRVRLGGTATFNTVFGIKLAANIEGGHKVYINGFGPTPINGGFYRNTRVYIYSQTGTYIESADWSAPYIYTAPAGGCRIDIGFVVKANETYNYFVHPFIIELTDTYGVGYEPDLNTCNSTFTLPWYPYNVLEEIE